MDKVQRILYDLGRTADEVAKTLSNVRVGEINHSHTGGVKCNLCRCSKGIRYSAYDNPLSDYLRIKLVAKNQYAVHSGYHHIITDKWHHISSDDFKPIREFLANFDRGNYPELEFKKLVECKPAMKDYDDVVKDANS